MKDKKYALSLFTKAPQPGKTKTRLTVNYGGALTDQEAADFYRSTMLDVLNAASQALKSCRRMNIKSELKTIYDFIISSSSNEDKNKLQLIFNDELTGVNDISYVIDQGKNFDEHFNFLYHSLFDRGYHSVICIGGDLPTISPDFIIKAFKQLDDLEKESQNGAMVIAPCQAAGVSLVGLTANAPMDFKGVFYNMNGVPALEAIIKIAAERNIPTAVLDTQADVDTMEDLGHMIALIHSLDYASRFSPEIYVPRHTLAWINEIGLEVNTPPNNEHDPRGE
jgi:uncharacterized protein